MYKSMFRMMYIPNHDVRIYHTGTTQNNRGCLSRGVHAVLPRRRFEREWVCVVRRADSTSAVRRGAARRSAARRGGTVAWPARAERRPPRIFYAYSVLYIQRPVINFYIYNFWHILFHLFVPFKKKETVSKNMQPNPTLFHNSKVCASTRCLLSR